MTDTRQQQDDSGRRPLKVRQAGLARTAAVWLTNKQITPNQISVTSIFFAALAALCLILLPLTSQPGDWLLPLLAAFFIQCRLLCNLFDGMVAVEGGKSTPAGELFNDVPDRIADPLILVAAGYAAAGTTDWAITAGWCAGLLAVMTAYIRTLSVSIGAPADFRGPMAKQHRMALMTAACLLTLFESQFWPQGYILVTCLVIIIPGAALTIYRRGRQAYLFLETQQSTEG